MRYILCLLLGLLAFPAWGAPPAYTVVKEKSALKFFAIENSAPVEGRFQDFTADIRFDPDHLDQSTITVEVPLGGISLTNKDAEDTLKTPDWLSPEAFPKAIFKSKKISRMPMSDNYYAEGELTLKGKTVPVMLNFQLKNSGSTTIAEGSTTLRRSDFGVGQGEWAKTDVLKNEVRVEFRILAEKQP